MKKKRFIPRVEAAFLLLVFFILLTGFVLVLCSHPSPVAARVRGAGESCAFPPVAVSLEGVPINAGDASLLDTLPQIGPVTAQAILQEREANGPFFYPEDLDAVKGIGPKTVELLRPLISFQLETPRPPVSNEPAPSPANDVGAWP